MSAIGREGRHIQMRLIEDSPGDVRLTREAFRDANTAIQLHVASDGVAAMAFLRREGTHIQAPRPDLILADIATSYQSHANSYLKKPVQLDEFEALVKRANDFWLTKAILPQQEHRA
ncbi:MAG: response regulator [Roseiflexaceae bacterium]